MDVVQPNGKTVHYKRGDTAFLRRNHKVRKDKHSNAKGEFYRVVSTPQYRIFEASEEGIPYCCTTK